MDEIERDQKLDKFRGLKGVAEEIDPSVGSIDLLTDRQVETRQSAEWWRDQQRPTQFDQILITDEPNSDRSRHRRLRHTKTA